MNNGHEVIRKILSPNIGAGLNVSPKEVFAHVKAVSKADFDAKGAMSRAARARLSSHGKGYIGVGHMGHKHK